MEVRAGTQRSRTAQRRGYRVGAGGLQYSPQQTFRWYSRSALAGDANGQCNLGACYEHGLGCAQSYVKAVKWYRLSAGQALGTASMNLGYCYLSGRGVPAGEHGADATRLDVSSSVRTPGQGCTGWTASEAGLRSERRREALRLFRLAVEQGEEKARPEVERLEGRVKKPRILLVDASEAGTHFGIVGVSGVVPASDAAAELPEATESRRES